MSHISTIAIAFAGWLVNCYTSGAHRQQPSSLVSPAAHDMSPDVSSSAARRSTRSAMP